MFAEVCRDPSEPSLIGELRRQAFGVAEMLEAGPVAAERPERIPESETNVDGLPRASTVPSWTSPATDQRT